MADPLLQRRWRSLRRKVRHKIHDAKTFTHPGVKVGIVAVLILATAAAVVYAMKSDPANHPPEIPTDSNSMSVPVSPQPALGVLTPP